MGLLCEGPEAEWSEKEALGISHRTQLKLCIVHTFQQQRICGSPREGRVRTHLGVKFFLKGEVEKKTSEDRRNLLLTEKRGGRVQAPLPQDGGPGKKFSKEVQESMLLVIGGGLEPAEKKDLFQTGRQTGKKVFQAMISGGLLGRILAKDGKR